MGKRLEKEGLDKFLKNSSKGGILVGPVITDMLRFQEIEDAGEICFEGNPTFGIKKFFVPPKNPILKFKGAKLLGVETPKKTVIFGARLCDTNSLLKTDQLYLNDYPDEDYKTRRENTVLMALACSESCNEYAFCKSMNDIGHYDLLFVDKGDYFYVDIGTEKGQRLVKNLKDAQETLPDIYPSTRALNKHNIRAYLDEKHWHKDRQNCLSCSRCSMVCPNCLCFDVTDVVDITLKNGERVRKWDSCQLKNFTTVAGGHVFREARFNRFRHFVFHKIQYFAEKYGSHMCTGCGRCIKHCPKTIDWPKTINELK
ncbi:hypothetical protein GOV04_00955 [Candidatus Woesearchaeota archaeon]|nr:hypothetical protein [Candidatus Woesearchaeota archaeon]